MGVMGVGSNHLAQDTEGWWVLVNMVMIVWVM
jgi:hypothetical protein